MKKSILSLSAAVALGALGFAGSANAIAVFSDDGTTATELVQTNGGTGHMLFTPYYTAQDNLATLVNIVNTDTQNGKAVKVRFRGASNSDDVLDFTLFLSPGDVWSGMVSQAASGYAQIDSSSDETSCTIPDKSAFPGEFMDLRLPSYVSADVAAALTREGYVEVLNMADIPFSSAKGSLYEAIKHKNGVAPCTLDLDTLLSTDIVTAAQARAIGLDNPTGGLMGSWTILNQTDMGVYSGAQTAIAANTGGNKANFVFAPQIEEAIGNPGFVNRNTADPLLTIHNLAGNPVLNPLWYDLPDMSSPLLSGETAVQQANHLSDSMSKRNVINEYVATSAGASVPYLTDWVVSQPTRRYHAAVNYGASSAAAIGWFREDSPYDGMVTRQTEYGPQGCMSFNFGSYDREENTRSAAGGFSPGTTSPHCGEVFTLQFGSQSALRAAITARSVNGLKAGDAGWARLSTSVARGLPMTGFAATQFVNEVTGAKYNVTLPHRWND